MKRRTTTSRRTRRSRGVTKATASRQKAPRTHRADAALSFEVQELDALRHELERQRSRLDEPRWNVNPEDAQRSVAKLVLTLVEFLRKLMERQAIRRMENGTLNDAQIEAIGLALMRLEETIADMAKRFGLSPDDLNLELGPLGRLI
jgi:Gas vesicle protein K